MALFHPDLTQAKWNGADRAFQVLSIFAELNRCRGRVERDDLTNARHSLDRVLELIDLTVADPRWTGGRRAELLRFREAVGALYVGSEEIRTTPAELMRVLRTFHPVSSTVPV